MTDAERERVYSQDYWDIVVTQLKRRPAVIVSTIILILMYAIAIYAPIVANGRPILITGVDLAAFRNSQRELVATTGAFLSAVEREDPDAIATEATAVRFRLARLEAAVSPANGEPFRELSRAVTEAETTSDPGELEAKAKRISAEAASLRQRIRPVAPGNADPAGGTLELVPKTSFPVLESLGRGDVYFMVLWAFVLTFPIWNRLVDRVWLGGDPFRARRARRVKAITVVVLPALAAVFWPGRQAGAFTSEYKDRLQSGDIIATRAIFPLIPFGTAESNGSENFRPPTWHRESIKDEDGFYLYGPRAGRFDEATGLPKMAHPVIVRGGEPGPNNPWRHPLGTDSLGRDVLARLCWGARISLSVGLISTVLLVFIGIFFGALAGYYRGWVDLLISRVIEIVQTFPFFFLVLIIVAFIGPSVLNIMLGIGLIRWTGVARLVRGEFIRLREQDFVVASRALGVPNLRTIFRHVLPNAMGPVLVAATFSVAAGILTESGLSFLGFGVQLPIPSWGSLFIESRAAEHWWIQIYPGLLIFITVMLYNLLGEGIRDALDPRLKVM